MGAQFEEVPDESLRGWCYLEERAGWRLYVADGAIAFMRHQPCIGLVPFMIGLPPDFCSETSRRARKLILWRHPYYVAQMFTGRLDTSCSQSHMFRARHLHLMQKSPFRRKQRQKNTGRHQALAAWDLCIGSFLLSLRRPRDRTCPGSERRASAGRGLTARGDG